MRLRWGFCLGGEEWAEDVYHPRDDAKGRRGEDGDADPGAHPED